MNAFNRFVVAVIALAWLAALGLSLFLIWDEERAIDISTSSVRFGFDLMLSSRSDQVLATIIVGLLAFPGLMLLAMQFVPARGRPVEDRRVTDRYGRLEQRIDALQQELARERTRPADTPRPEPADHPRRWRFLGSARH